MGEASFQSRRLKKSDRVNSGHFGDIMLEQRLNAVLQGGCGRGTAGTGALHRQKDVAIAIATKPDVAAIIGDSRANAGFEEIIDLIDYVGVSWIRFNHKIRSVCFRRNRYPVSSVLKDRHTRGKMIEQQRRNIRLQRRPVRARRRSHRNEVPAEMHARDIPELKKDGGERRCLCGLGRREVTRTTMHDDTAGQEFAGRRVWREFGLNKHGVHVGLPHAACKRRTTR
jgi:hypothetical protein